MSYGRTLSTTVRPIALLVALCLAAAAPAAELHQAVQTGDLAGVKALLAEGADPDARGQRLGFTPLHLSVYMDKLEIGELLLAAGADVDARNDLELSALDLAVLLGKVEAAALLVAHGADLEAHNGQDHRPLTQAAGRGHGEIVDMLLDAGVDLEARNRQGRTALLEATVAGRAEIVAQLIARGARVDAGDDRHGRPPLHHACLGGHLDVVRSILDAGAAVDAVDARGETALHLAARHGHRQVADLLLARSAGRPEDLVESYGRSPYLQDPPAAGGAVAWYLNHRGWAVKTHGRLLVFDAEEFGVTRPADPALANGFLAADELADEQLLGLYTCYHGDPGELAFVHELADEVAGAAYVHLRDDRFRDGPNCLYLAPGELREIGGATVRTLDAPTGNATHAYLVVADGLTIYYQGFNVSEPEPFLRDLAAAAEQVARVDLAFLPIPEPGETQQTADAPLLRTLELLRPRAVCLLDPERRESLYPEVARRLMEAGFEGRVFCAENPGDHLVYEGAKPR